MFQTFPTPLNIAPEPMSNNQVALGSDFCPILSHHLGGTNNYMCLQQLITLLMPKNGKFCKTRFRLCHVGRPEKSCHLAGDIPGIGCHLSWQTISALERTTNPAGGYNDPPITSHSAANSAKFYREYFATCSGSEMPSASFASGIGSAGVNFSGITPAQTFIE